MSYYSISLGAHFGASLSAASSAVSSAVPGLFPVGIAGRPYLPNLDPQFSLGIRFSRDSLPLLRTQADSARTSGESSVSPENLWRRSIDSWHHGAGQTHYDRDNSDPYRFNASVGVDPWEFGQISLLNGTSKNKSATNSNLKMVVADGYVFWIDNASTYYAQLTGSTWGSTSTVTGTPGGVSATGIATNGKYVYVAYGTSGIYRIDTASPGTAAVLATMPSSASCIGVWFNKGRLFAAQSTGIINEVTETTSSVLATSYSTAQNYAIVVLNATHTTQSLANFTFTASDALGNYHYFGGYFADKSSIYKTTIGDNSTNKLLVGSIALDMPDGEYVTSLNSYLGFMVVGTSKGVRLAQQESDGSLTLGPLIPTPAPVYCAEGQDRFIWFGWSSNADSGFSGLGRMDLTVFNKPLQPAYATDLMADATGTVSSVVTTSDGRLAFTVVGSGVYADSGSVLSSGWITSGQITHGITDEKVTVFQGVRHSALANGQSVTIYHSVNGGDFNTVGVSDLVGTLQSPDFYVGERNTFIETKISINGSCSVTGVLARSYPSPRRLTRFTVPVLLHDSVTALNQRDYPLDVGVEYDFLTQLHSDQTIVAYQEGESTYSVVVDDFSWIPEKYSIKAKRFQGTLVLVLRQIS